MMYRERGTEVEAYQVLEEVDIWDYPLWLKKEINVDRVIISRLDDSLGYIRTSSGVKFFYDRDYLVEGAHGGVYVFKEDDFKERYEEVEKTN